MSQKKAEEKSSLDNRITTQKQNELNDYINSRVQSTQLNDTHLNFIKIHLMNHFTRQIRQYGSLPQWSTEAQEHAHKINLKDG
jgi:hypothetical protein